MIHLVFWIGMLCILGGMFGAIGVGLGLVISAIITVINN